MFNPRLFAAPCLALLILAAPHLFAYPRPGETVGLDERPDTGLLLGGYSYSGAISGDGQAMMFQAFGEHLTPGAGDTGFDTFVRRLQTGIISRLSVNSDGSPAIGESQYGTLFSDISTMHLSRDGTVAAFVSKAPLVSDDTNGTYDVYVYDSTTQVLERGSVATGNVQLDDCQSPQLSPDGRFLAFARAGLALYVRDRMTGITERVDVSTSGQPANFTSYGPSISDDGRFVAFQSSASNLGVFAEDESIFASGAAIYLRDRLLGTTERISVFSHDPETKANGPCYMPDISGDGRYIGYRTLASDLIPQDTNQVNDILVYDRVAGRDRRVSVNSDGEQADAHSFAVSMSKDGRFVTFHSAATNLVPNDTNAASDVFVHDLLLGVTERVSVAGNGDQSEPIPSSTIPLSSEFPAISSTGSHVIFQSGASNFASNHNGGRNVYRRHRGERIGILRADIAQTDCDVQITGVSTFAGAMLSTAVDPVTPAPALDVPGGDLERAEIALRPEEEDLYVRISVPGLPGQGVSGLVGRIVCFYGTASVVNACPPSVTTGPYVGYRLDFSLAGVLHRIIIGTTGAVLYQCDSVCVPVGPVPSQVGVTGQEIVVTVPLSSLNAPAGTPVTGIEVVSTLFDSPLGSAQDLDSLALPGAVLPAPAVRIGIAAPEVAEASVNYTATATPSAGNFTANVTGSGNEANVWLQACIGDTCGPARSHPIGGCLVQPVELVSVASRKDHGPAGPFDLDLPIAGSTGIECRHGGVNGDHTIVFSFASNLASIGGASITSGAGAITSAAIGADPREYVVHLTGVTDAQLLTINLSTVSDTAGGVTSELPFTLGFLLGDTGGNGTVNSSDIGQTKANSGKDTTSATFRTDVNTNGVINSSDIGLVKSKSGAALP